MAISPSYQLSYGSLPFVSVGKLQGLPFKLQFHNLFSLQPDYLFLASFNEYISQPQKNPYVGTWDNAFSMGLPYDPLGTNLYVDIYGWEFGRDIEPSEKYGSYIYDIMVSCLRLYKQNATACTNMSEICCDVNSSAVFTNVYSLQSTPSSHISDYLLTTSETEMESLVQSGAYLQVCNPYGGTTTFCTTSVPNPQSGPFIIYSQDIYGDLYGLYACVETGTSSHFFSTDPKCEGQSLQSMLGYISPIRSRETYRSLFRCYNASVNVHYHSLDLECPSQDYDTPILGFVR